MNGVLNFSVLDGWWYEGYKEGAGWALTDKRTYKNQDHQDQLDAATIYSMLETEIIPLYFAKNSKGYSPDWVQFVKNSFAKISPFYTTKRMLDDYIERFYTKQAKRGKALKAKDFAKAKEIAAWKENVAARWDSIEVCSLVVSDTFHPVTEVGQVHKVTVEIDVKDASLLNSIGVEGVSTVLTAEGVDKFYSVKELSLVKTEGTKLTFELNLEIINGGSFKYSFRMFPKNSDLPHRQDFCYVRWF